MEAISGLTQCHVYPVHQIYISRNAPDNLPYPLRYDIASPVPDWLSDVTGPEVWSGSTYAVVFMGETGASALNDMAEQIAAHLAALPDLEVIKLYSTDITDDGLLEFADLATLRFIILQKTNITDEGIRQFHKRASHIRVIRDQAHSFRFW